MNREPCDHKYVTETYGDDGFLIYWCRRCGALKEASYGARWKLPMFTRKASRIRPSETVNGDSK